MAASRHFGFVWGHIWTTNSEYLGVSITLQNLVMIDAVFLLYEHFNIWHVWLENAYSLPKNCFFLWAI